MRAPQFSMILRYLFDVPLKQRFEMIKESGLGLAYRVGVSPGEGELHNA